MPAHLGPRSLTQDCKRIVCWQAGEKAHQERQKAGAACSASLSSVPSSHRHPCAAPSALSSQSVYVDAQCPGVCSFYRPSQSIEKLGAPVSAAFVRLSLMWCGYCREKTKKKSKGLLCTSMGATGIFRPGPHVRHTRSSESRFGHLCTVRLNTGEGRREAHNRCTDRLFIIDSTERRTVLLQCSRYARQCS